MASDAVSGAIGADSAHPGPGSEEPGLDQRPLRLVTYNVQHGLGPDGKVDVDRFAQAVADLDADVLALQEVEQDSPRSRHAHLSAVAAQAIGAEAWRFAPTLRKRRQRWVRAEGMVGRGVPDRPQRAVVALTGTGAGANKATGARRPAAVAGVPRYGIALVSRYPVERWWRLDLPQIGPRERGRRLFAALRASHTDKVGGRTMLRLLRQGPHLVRDEPRAAIAARIRTPGGPLTVVATHLTVLASATSDQLTALVAAAARLPGPVVVLGDLNLTPPEVLRPGWVSLADAATYPVAHPAHQIDHILTSGAVAPLTPAESVDTGLSDHRALRVDVRLGTLPPVAS